MYAVVHYEEPMGTHILSPTDTVHVFEDFFEASDFLCRDHAYRTWAVDNWEEIFTGDEYMGGISRSYKNDSPKGAVTTNSKDTTDFINEWVEAAVGAALLFAFFFFGAAMC